MKNLNSDFPSVAFPSAVFLFQSLQVENILCNFNAFLQKQTDREEQSSLDSLYCNDEAAETGRSHL